jgi:hypothetical protein
MRGEGAGTPCAAAAGFGPSWRSSSRISDSRKRRWPPGVRMLLIRPAAAQRVTVFGSTRKRLATSPGVSSRSRDSTTTNPLTERLLHADLIQCGGFAHRCQPKFPNGSESLRWSSPSYPAFVAIGGVKQPRGASRAVLAYNLCRLGLLVLCLGIGWLAGLRGFWLIVAALFVSGVASWFLLRAQREAMGRAVEQTVERSRVRMAARTNAEDSYVDAMLAATEPTPESGPRAAAPTGDTPTS